MTFLNYCLKVNSIVKFWPAVAVGMAAAASHGYCANNSNSYSEHTYFNMIPSTCSP